MKLRQIKAAVLELDNGDAVHVEFIGKGRFSEAWKNGTAVYIITRDRSWGTDYSKEMLSNLDSDNQHIPQVERLGDIDGRDDVVFKMPLYKSLSAKDKSAWAQFKELERLKQIAWGEVFPNVYGQRFNNHNGLQLCNRVVELARESAIIPDSLVDALEEMTDNISNYGDSWVFEFAKRNLTVDANGNLILLDVLFDLEVMERERAERAKRTSRY